MDPKLISTRIVIEYESDDGYEYMTVFGGKLANPRTRPEENLVQAIDELGRISALFGFDDKAYEAFNAARARVGEWFKNREKKGGE